MQSNKVIMPYTQPNFYQIWKKRYISANLSEKFDSLQQRSTKGAPQYELNSFVTMVTYWYVLGENFWLVIL